MRICCVVETTYQLINIINLLTNDKEFIGAEVDVFVRDNHFAYSSDYCERIKKLGLFNSVNLFNLYYNSCKINLFNNLINIPKFTFAATTINRSIGKGFKFKKNTYDIILTPNGCVFFKLAMFSNPKAKIYCYEDGLLSYSGRNWVLNDFSKFSQLFMKFIGRGNDYLPERVYVNTPELCEIAWDAELLKLPSLKEALRKEDNVFYKIFGLPICDYNENKVVFLSQPLIDETTLSITKSINEPFVSRYHPRDKKELILGGQHDRCSSQWELICAGSITDEHILIAACSTAQVSPKWMFGMEPYLIFTYPIYKDTVGERFIRVSEDIVAKTRGLYKNPEKVFVVHTTDEINEVLSRIERE